MKKAKKLLCLILALIMLMSILPTFAITTSANEPVPFPAHWTQAGTTTLAQGNLARTGTTVSQYDNGANTGDRATNGTLPTAAGNNHWNTWGAAAAQGSQNSPVWIYQHWTQPYVVEGTRVLWHIFTDAGVR